jgi:hypothetical protein
MYIPSFAQKFPVYQPAMRVIANITNSFPVTITTTFNHQYVTGLIVRIDVPLGLGIQQLNQMFGPITVTGNTTFTLPIDTTNFDAFILPTANSGYQDAQSVPIGEVSSMISAATQNVLPYPAT